MRSKSIFFIALIYTGQCFGQAPLKGLQSYYPFSGNAHDFMGEHNGTVNGAQLVQDRFGNDNSAYLFDGTDDYIRIDNPAFVSDSEGTFSAWIKFNSLNGIQYVASVADEDSQHDYLSLIRFDPNHKKLSVYNGDPVQTNYILGSALIDTGRYYHVVMTGNSAQWQLILDNNRELLIPKVGQNSGEWFSGINGIDNFIIGGIFIQQPHETAYFNGVIDDIRIYDRVLDSVEIAALYYENTCYKTVIDTVRTYETVVVYDTVAVTDTLIIDFSYLNSSETLHGNIKAFPVPARGVLSIRIENYQQLDQYFVRIVSSSGTVIFERSIYEPEFSVDLNGSDTGLYLLQITDVDKNIIDTRKIILR